MINSDFYENRQYDVQFNFSWRGRKDSNPMGPIWHEPGVMDGGSVVSSSFKMIDNNNGILSVYLGQDDFFCETWDYEIEIPIVKKENYHIWVDDNKILCDKPFKATNIKAERSKRIEQLPDLPPVMKLVRTANPITIKDKIFAELVH